jgi:DDE superfamily endonuclease
VVVDHYKIHQARAVERWLAAPHRIELVFLPTYCPKAHPIERLFGDTHDQVTRNHTRKQIWPLVEDVKRHWAANGPWHDRRSESYFTAEVTAAVQRLKTQAKASA